VKQAILRKSARNRFVNHCEIVSDKYEADWFHEILCNVLQKAFIKVQKGESARIIIEVPPRHGKSETSTIHFPSWVLGQEPEWPIITSSYSADLSQDFGQATRDIMRSENYKLLYDVELREDTQAKGKWKTEKGGGYTAVGVGGPLTGKGFKIGIIDDPHKNRQDADSEVMRNNVWKWYTSTFYTRQEGVSAIIVIMCMTGDTPVMLSDGTEKLLRDIRIGDKVATYKNGKLTSSKVKNWKSNGVDEVFKIKTSSGIIVKANKRHPFLIYDNGKIKWIQTKDLHPDQEIFRVNGESGKVKSVNGKNVKNRLYVEDIVHHIIQKKDGQMGLEHLLLIVNHTVGHALNIVMGLLWKIINVCFQNKAEDVQYANNRQEIMSEHIGEENYALTTTTKQKKLGLFSVMIATLLSVIRRILKPLWLLLNTSDFTLDKIIEITPAGFEEVYDVQIEDTENFIANGLVSHNTRWHIDDLVGRLLKQQEENEQAGLEHYDKWERIKFPAIATKDEKYRKKGEALWGKKFPLEVLENTKNNIGPMEWSALYQQNPLAGELMEFKEEYIRYFNEEDLPPKMHIDITVDPAISKKKDACNTSIIAVGKAYRNPNWYILDYKVGKFDPFELIDKTFNLVKETKELYPDATLHVRVEGVAYQESLKYYFREEMKKREFYFMLDTFTETTDKLQRIRGLVPLYKTGVIYHRRWMKEIEEELINFPQSKTIDIMDSLAAQLKFKMNTEKPIEEDKFTRLIDRMAKRNNTNNDYFEETFL